MSRLLRAIVLLGVGAVALLACVPNAFAQSTFSGTLASDTTWTAADSPILVTGTLVVPPGVTLTIQPGVVVKFSDAAALLVDGTLVARGTTPSPILFTSNQTPVAPGQWLYLAFSDTSADASSDAAGTYGSGSVLEHAIVEGAGESDAQSSAWAVQVRNATPLFKSVTIRTNRGTGLDISLDGNDPQPGPMKIFDSEIAGNEGGVRVSSPHHTLLIQGNWIHDNTARALSVSASSGDTQIRLNTITDHGEEGLDAQISAGTFQFAGNEVARNSRGVSVAGGNPGTMTLTENVVHDNGPDGGMRVDVGSGPVTITGNTIYRNWIDLLHEGGQGAGLALNGAGNGTATVSHNVISDNVAAASAGGVWLYGPQGSVTLDGNAMIGNVAPTASAMATAPVVGFTLVRNTITQNRATSANGSAIVLEAGFAGTLSQNNIFSNVPPDAAETGSPELTAPVSPPSGVRMTSDAGGLHLTWTASPEADVAGYKIYYGLPDGPPYVGTEANETRTMSGASVPENSPIDVGNVTSFTLTGLSPGRAVRLTAYDIHRDGVTDQTDGNESWYAAEPPTITWEDPAAIPFGTALSATQLNAMSNVPGTFVYTPAAGTVLPLGAHQALSVAFTPADQASYPSTSATVHIDVASSMPAITWADPAPITYPLSLGTAQQNATAPVPGTFTYFPPGGSILEPGLGQPISVTFRPTDLTHFASSSATVHIDVRARPTITWSDPPAMVSGTALGAAQLNATASVPGTFAYVPPAGTVLAPGAGQQLFVTFTPTDQTRYSTAVAVVHVAVLLLPPGGIAGTVTNRLHEPVAGVQVHAYDSQNVDNSVITNASGLYQFTLPAGTYHVTAHTDGVNYVTEAFRHVFCGAGCSPTTGSAVTVTPSATTIVDFALFPSMGGIAGYVHSGSAPIPGMTMVLVDAQGNIARTVDTDADGGFLTDNLPPGVYRVGTFDTLGYAGGCAPTAPCARTVTHTWNVTNGFLDFDFVVNTPVGATVAVTPMTDTGTTPITLTFHNVTSAGRTTVARAYGNPFPPQAYVLPQPQVHFEPATTAAFTSADVCINYSDFSISDATRLRVVHLVGGSWIDETTTHNLATRVICAAFTSLSPFAIVLPADPSIVVTPSVFPAGSTVTVAWNAVPSPSVTDWIGVSSIPSSGAVDTSQLKWRPNGAAAGSLSATLPTWLPPGFYKMYYYTHNTDVVVALGDQLIIGAPVVQNPPAPNDVVAAPVAESGLTPVVVTFHGVTSVGVTSLTTASNTPVPMTALRLGDWPRYYTLSTGTTFTSADVCINYAGAYGSEDPHTRALHLVGNVWINETTSVDVATYTVCAHVTSLGIFIAGAPADPRDIPPAGGISGYIHSGAVPIAGATVLVANAAGVIVTTTLSDANGGFVTSDLATGVYRVGTFNALGYLGGCQPANPCARIVTHTAGVTDGFLNYDLAVNTPAGSTVAVTPVSPTGTTPASVTFHSVFMAGLTTLAVSSGNPVPTTGFQLGQPPTYYVLATTASFVSADVCINYAGVSYADPTQLRVLHQVNGVWLDETTSNTVATTTICAHVTSFSPFTIAFPLTPASLVASPSSALVSGGAMTVTWNALSAPRATDWMGLYRQGTADSAYLLTWRPTGAAAGSQSVTLPSGLAAGQYEVRYFVDNTYGRLLVSAPINVSATAGAVALSPGVVTAGASVTVTWSQMTGARATDWMGLYPVGAPNSGYVRTWRTDGSASGSLSVTVPASVAAGSYEARYFEDNTYRLAATSAPVTVTAAAASVAVAGSFLVPGATTTVTWDGIPLPRATDWFGLYQVGTPDSAYLQTWRPDGSGHGSLGITLPATLTGGSYEVRYFLDNTYQRLTTSPSFTVPLLAISPGAVVGGDVTITWSGILPGRATDWLGLYRPGAANSEYLVTWRPDGSPAGTHLLTIPGTYAAGLYEVRYFLDNTYTVLMTSLPASVAAAGAPLLTVPNLATVGNTIAVGWGSIPQPRPTDWLGLYAVGAPNGAYLLTWRPSGSALGTSDITLPGSLPAGNYEVRYFLDNTYDRLLASDPMTVN